MAGGGAIGPVPPTQAPSVAGEVAKFALAGALALGLVGLGTLLAARRVGERQAITEVRSTAVTKSELVTPGIVEGLLAGDPDTVARIDEVSRVGILDSDLVRVKLWTADGTILYSDVADLIGRSYALGAEEQASLHTGAIEAEVSNLQKPENRFERDFGRLLEVYLPVYSDGGEPVLFEAYFRYTEVSRAGSELWRSFAPIGLGALLLLELVQIPLAWSLARRLRDRHREREAFLARAVRASEVERRRIASDLHDGVVQDLAGVAYSLSAAARSEVEPGAAAVLESSADQVRSTMKPLRSLLVELYPPNLEEQGLEAALADLLATAEARGLGTELRFGADGPLDPAAEQLLYRAAQEGVRNVVHHAHASTLTVEVGEAPGGTVLRVIDDGVGIDPTVVGSRVADGHLGLRGLDNLAREKGGTMTVGPSPDGGGTQLTLEVPRR
jgi:two-component system NarL family sensor kinase